jgi:ubiquinone/menaquinone biosynthesis C-methylase UbiE
MAGGRDLVGESADPSRTDEPGDRVPDSDAVFTDAMSGRYERLLGPALFAPFAERVCTVVAQNRPADILETAAGTGILTRRMADALPDAQITATDLNAPMLDFAQLACPRPNVRWQQADAQSLPFDDGSFDLVVCQFGAMFFADRQAAYREARRILQPGKRFILAIWADVDDNDFSRVAETAAAPYFSGAVPSFLRRVPYGYADRDEIRGDLTAAGFARAEVETVALTVRASAADFARGICEGTPLAADLGDSIETAVAAATDALLAELGTGTRGEMEGVDTAHLVVASSSRRLR